MDITELLHPGLVKFNIKANEKWPAIRELSELLHTQNIIESIEVFLEAVKEREEQVSTGVGSGIAIPHAISVTVNSPAIVFGRSDNGIKYDSIDNEPIYLVFLFAIPNLFHNKDYLLTLANLARLLVHDSVRTKLRKANKFKEVTEALRLDK